MRHRQHSRSRQWRGYKTRDAPHNDMGVRAPGLCGRNQKRGRATAGHLVKKTCESGRNGRIALNDKHGSSDKFHCGRHSTEQGSELCGVGVEEQGHVERTAPQIAGMTQRSPAHGEPAQTRGGPTHGCGSAYKETR